jgi:hypothetical protein
MLLVWHVRAWTASQGPKREINGLMKSNDSAFKYIFFPNQWS